MSRRVALVVDLPRHGPAPRCDGCGQYFRAERAVCVEVWATTPTPEPLVGWLYCPDCRDPQSPTGGEAT